MALNFVTKNIGSRGKEFHGTAQISKTGCEMFSRPVTEPYLSIARDHGYVVADMVTRLMRVEGVVQIFVSPYEVTVYMADAFKWNNQIDKIAEQAFHMALVATPSKTKPRKVVVETFPNNLIRDYNTDFEVSKSQREEFWKPLRVSSIDHLIKTGLQNADFVQLLFDIDGITQVIMHPYQVGIYIGAAFEWSKVQPKIMRAFEAIYGSVEVKTK